MATATSKRWWLALNGAADGPRTETYITAALQSGQLPGTTQACLEGTTDWLPLSRWPEFNKVAATASPPPPPPPGSAVVEPVLTNPSLPQFANWICIYCICVVPLIWIVENLSCMLEESVYKDAEYSILVAISDLIGGLLDLPIVILLAVGGLGLRRLRSAGATMIQIALWLRSVWVAVLIAMSWVFHTMAERQGLDTSLDPQAPAFIIFFVLGAIQVCELAFDIAALIWLTRRRRNLPLSG